MTTSQFVYIKHEKKVLNMITIFNRKELAIVNTMKEQAEIRDFLAANNIRYYIKVYDLFSHGSSRGRTVSLGINMDAAYEYMIYVHKDDYETAHAILSGKIRK